MRWMKPTKNQIERNSISAFTKYGTLIANEFWPKHQTLNPKSDSYRATTTTIVIIIIIVRKWCKRNWILIWANCEFDKVHSTWHQFASNALANKRLSAIHEKLIQHIWLTAINGFTYILCDRKYWIWKYQTKDASIQRRFANFANQWYSIRWKRAIRNSIINCSVPLIRTASQGVGLVMHWIPASKYAIFYSLYQYSYIILWNEPSWPKKYMINFTSIYLRCLQLECDTNIIIIICGALDTDTHLKWGPYSHWWKPKWYKRFALCLDSMIMAMAYSHRVAQYPICKWCSWVMASLRVHWHTIEFPFRRYGMVLARYRAVPAIKSTGCFGQKPLVAFTSEESHYSIKKGVHWLGIGTENLISVRSDANGCMRVDDLIECIEQVLKQNRQPFFVNATAGTTILGAFDNLSEIADVCQRYNIWLHVDVSSKWLRTSFAPANLV